MNQIGQSDINRIVELLQAKISPYLVILFGSAVKGAMTPESDIDIAFLTDYKVNEYEIFLLAQELADRLGREVDLVNLDKASTVFRAQVVGTGKIIHDGDPYRRKLFQMNTLSQYALLNEERQCIFDKLKERGTLFGE
ncbi:type VII toxin-antitoxin system MntA family adenylyltransferase antitoxin [Effusibacillus pohliae]|uniref:type VII toxin-antitoxin system MntA family adenylyltransferase antitoxin n=1 Tax=Effusibacillus pohliae TaxID=232270 RepID=UPI00037396AE|nr:nucleotidyltransferase domain-containing protein [Effusibacillus pohliae]